MTDPVSVVFFQFQIVVDESTKKDLDLKVEVDHQEENREKRMKSEIELAEMVAPIGIEIGKIRGISILGEVRNAEV